MIEEEPHPDLPPINPNIDVDRLLKDLNITDADMELLDRLFIPKTVVVTSASKIKTDTVTDALRIAFPNKEFNVVGVKVSSGENEQPIGLGGLRGANTRIDNALEEVRQGKVRGEISSEDDICVISIENAIFEEGAPDTTAPLQEGSVVDAGGASMNEIYDPVAEYEDRAVAAIRIPELPRVIQVSPGTEAVHFPKVAVEVAASDGDNNGFVGVTVGSKLKEVGAVIDNQNPHKELTVGRAGGPLPREDQMARVIIRSLITAARVAATSSASKV